MKYSEFKIKNFKGIENITFDLDKSPEANIYTLVGLNESGKTTILEAINLFNPTDQGLSALEIPGTSIKDFNLLIPISRRDNFTDTVSIEVTLSLEQSDLDRINEFLNKETIFRQVQPVNELKYYRNYIFKDSVFVEHQRRWDSFKGILKSESSENYISIGDNNYPKVNDQLAKFCRSLIPSILYFPNFLFDFPDKIYLIPEGEIKAKENFYFDLIQDILFSLNNDTFIKPHIADRILSNDINQRKNLDRLIQLMERKITEVVFDAWNRIFKRQIRDTRIIINYNTEASGRPYLEFEIEATDGIYQINERSLGFRWFFVFLLFTQFRPFRRDTPQNVIFLFDEPASNLHSSAQKQLLTSFENLIGNSKIIYTTHSHHLINPKWLESTYVVRNEGLRIENPETYNIKKTNISIQPYREFVTLHPHNTAYFQPVLDVLDYAPSDLESIPNCIFLEGKNDYYTLEYFQNIISSAKNKLHFAPSTGSGNLDTLISLYIAWGKPCIILLDSDNEGKKQKKRYIDEYGLILENRVFTLVDINSSWENIALEGLFNSEEKLKIQKSAYPQSESYIKSNFNRALQEALMNGKKLDISKETKDKFSEIIIFLTKKISQKK